jgi:hypothetical protein
MLTCKYLFSEALYIVPNFLKEKICNTILVKCIISIFYLTWNTIVLSVLHWYTASDYIFDIFQKRNMRTKLYIYVPKVFGHCSFLLYISYKTPIFENFIPKSILVRFWWNFYQQKRERTSFFLGAHILYVHDLNTKTRNKLLFCLRTLHNSVMLEWFIIG